MSLNQLTSPYSNQNIDIYCNTVNCETLNADILNVDVIVVDNLTANSIDCIDLSATLIGASNIIANHQLTIPIVPNIALAPIQDEGSILQDNISGFPFISYDNAWLSLQGNIGLTGSRGATGSQGNTGSTGSQGIQGITGSTGATGSQGIQGIQGNTGATGPQGSTGLLSLNGLSTSTAPNQFFLVGTTGTSFNIVSSGTAHTFNLPAASLIGTGTVTNSTQTFGGTKTFANVIISGGSTLSTNTIGVTSGSTLALSPTTVTTNDLTVASASTLKTNLINITSGTSLTITPPVIISSATNATSTSTGSITTSGGIGAIKDVWCDNIFGKNQLTNYYSVELSNSISQTVSNGVQANLNLNTVGWNPSSMTVSTASGSSSITINKAGYYLVRASSYAFMTPSTGTFEGIYLYVGGTTYASQEFRNTSQSILQCMAIVSLAVSNVVTIQGVIQGVLPAFGAAGGSLDQNTRLTVVYLGS